LNLFADDDEEAALPDGSRSERTATLRARTHALTGRPCTVCGAGLCGHEALLTILLGARHAPRCANCAASELGETRAELCERSRQWILRRECFLEVWLEASAEEGLGAMDRPTCLFAATPDRIAATPIAPGPVAPTADALHDAGDLGCGDLVLDLKFKLADMAAGTVLEVRATDPAAPIDLPAWCGLVGHTLLHASPPRYWIRRKNR